MQFYNILSVHVNANLAQDLRNSRVDSCLWKKRDLEMDYAKSCFLSFLTILAQTACPRAQRMANTMTDGSGV